MTDIRAPLQTIIQESDQQQQQQKQQQKQQQQIGKDQEKANIDDLLKQIETINKNNFIIIPNTKVSKELEVLKTRLNDLIKKQKLSVKKKIQQLNKELQQENVQNRQQKADTIRKLQNQLLRMELQSKVSKPIRITTPKEQKTLESYKQTIQTLQQKLKGKEVERTVKELTKTQRANLDKEIAKLKKDILSKYNDMYKDLKQEEKPTTSPKPSGGGWFSDMFKKKPKQPKSDFLQKLKNLNENIVKAEQQVKLFNLRMLDPSDPLIFQKQQDNVKTLQQLNSKVQQLKNAKHVLQQENKKVQQLENAQKALQQKNKKQLEFQKGIKQTLEPLTRPKFTMPTAPKLTMPTAPNVSPDVLRSLNRLVSKFSSEASTKQYTENDLVKKIRQQLEFLRDLKKTISSYDAADQATILKEQQKYITDLNDLISQIDSKKQIVKSKGKNIDYLDEIIRNLKRILELFSENRRSKQQPKIQQQQQQQQMYAS